MPKYLDVVDPYKMALALCSNAHVTYILATALFLKIKKFKVIQYVTENPLHRYSDLAHGLISLLLELR